MAVLNIYVKRWNGNSWLQLGTHLDVNLSLNATTPASLDSLGNPVVSWQEMMATFHNIYVKRWNGGSTWVQLGLHL